MITSQTDKVGPVAITGLPQVIPTTFPFQQGTDLLVLDNGIANSNDPALVLVAGSDYMVTGGSYNAANQMLTGSVTIFAGGTSNVQVGDAITIARNVPVNQTTSLLETGPLTIALVEQALDKMATLSQQINELAGRSLHFENFENLSGNLSLAARKLSSLGFDANGNVAFLATPTGTLSLPVPIAQGGTGATSASGARTNLGLGTLSLQNANAADITGGISLADAGTTSIVNVKVFGAKGNGTVVTGNVSIASGFSVLTVSTASFAVGDVGKTVVVPGAGAAGADLITTISAFTSTTQVNLSATAGTTLSVVSKTVAYGTDDTTAINNAIAALTSHGTLYFPPSSGVYIVQSISGFAGLNNITVRGDGPSSHLFMIVNANNGFVFSNTCSVVTVTGLHLDAIGTSRANGIGIRMQCSSGSITGNIISGWSDFGCFFDDTTVTVQNSIFSNNLVSNTLGDGCHLGAAHQFIINNNIFLQTGDDAIATIGYSGNLCASGEIVGNTIVGRSTAIAGSNTHGNRGISIQQATNILVEGNIILFTYSAAIQTSDDANSGVYSSNISINGNHCYSCVRASGPLACIEAYFLTHSRISDNEIYDPSSVGTASGILVTDFTDVGVANNHISQSQNQFCRGIICNTGTAYPASMGRNFAATWSDLFITGNMLVLNQSSNNEAVYLPVNSALTISKLVCSGNITDCANSTIFNFDYITGLKVVLNIAIGTGSTITTGSHSTSVLATPNY